MQLDSLRLIKKGGWVHETPQRLAVTLHLASSHLDI
jgi:hypothetical protein